MKLRASTKIAIAAVVLVVGVYGGYQVVTNALIAGVKFPEIKPGKATLLGIDPGSGYHIIVANDVAALAEGGTDKLGTGDMSESASDTDTRRKLPINPLLEVLQGDAKHLGDLVMSINQIKRDDADIPNAPIWNAADVEKALGGDPKLKAKLESDLNVHLDGTPLNVVRVGAILNGIVLQIPVPVNVNVAGAPQTLIGQVLVPFRPRFVMELEQRRLHDKNLTNDIIRGYYFEEAKKVESGDSPKEDVATSLRTRIAKKRISELAAAPTNILSKARIILNEDFVESASMDTYGGEGDHTTYQLVLHLTDTGRRRLWQYSKLHSGTQLLFVVNGLAIGAPVIRSEIPGAEVRITNLPSGDIVKDAVHTINQYAKGKGTS